MSTLLDETATTGSHRLREGAFGNARALLCRECGHAEEIEQSQIEAWVTSVAQGHGFANVEHSLELFGTCVSCQEKNTTA